MFTPASISLHSLQHQACLPSDLSSPAGASTWGGVYIPGILLAFGGPCRSHVGEGGGSREETQSWSPCDLCCSGWEGETPSHVSPRGGPVLQGLAGPCSNIRIYLSPPKFPCVHLRSIPMPTPTLGQPLVCLLPLGFCFS